MGRRSEHRVTIHDIARAAGVSLTTVSFVLNGKGSINEKTREKVWEIAKEMSYVPNSIARALRGGRTFSLGVIVNNLHNHFFTSVFNGIERVTDVQGFAVLVSQTHDDVDKEKAQVRLLAERGVDGLILFPCSQEWAHVDEIVQRFELPTALIGNYFEDKEYLTVVADNWSGACKAVQHLIAQERWPIIHIAGPPIQTMCRIRRRAFESIMSANYQDFLSMEWIFPVDALGPIEGYRVMERVLQKHSPPFSLFVVNDDTALGVIRYCMDHELRIPQDVALIGFSDIETLNFLSTRLSTVRIPATAMGERAATILINCIRKGELPSPERLELPVDLVVRDSTILSGGPPSRNATSARYNEPFA